MSQVLDDRRPVGDRAAPYSLSTADRFDLRASSSLDLHSIRREFPILSEPLNGHRLVWLDNAATTQKPRAVINRLVQYYERENSNIHRSGHTLGARATTAYEHARRVVASFINAPSADDVIFVRGTTEAANLVASSWASEHVGAGDEIVISWLEHSSNILPWQQLAAERGASLRIIPIDDRGDVSLDAYRRLLNGRTRIVALAHASNSLGTVLPLKKMIALAHLHGARVFVDGAQAVAHLPVDVQALDADFYAFSGHKVYGPTGIGALYAKRGLLDDVRPWQFGGQMVSTLSFEDSTYRQGSARFEAGTGHIAGAVGLAAALEFLQALGLDRVHRHETALTAYALDALHGISGLRVIGNARTRIGVLSFVLDGWTPEQVGEALDNDGIAVRAGNHCAQPALRRFGADSSVRASLSLYNGDDDVDALVGSLKRLVVRKSSLVEPAATRLLQH